MNAEWKAKWLEALRSGSYQQGKGTLRYKGEFCCLGVLCDISGMGVWEETGCGFAYQVIEEAERGHLPDVVRRATELEWEMQTRLSGMNDEGWTFQKIADHIEEAL